MQPLTCSERFFDAGVALERDGRITEACNAYFQAMQLAPGHSVAQYRACRLLASLAETNSHHPAPAEAEASPGRPLASEPSISVIICSIDDAKFAAVAANYELLLRGYRHEIIGIHAAPSLCVGYNRGLARCSGDIVVFSHDDIEVLSTNFARKLIETLARNDIVGIAGATGFPERGLWARLGSPHPHGIVVNRAPGERRYAAYVFGIGGACDEGMQVLDGVFFATRRNVAAAVGFDARTFDGFHFYDIDFTYRAFLAGFRIAVSNEIVIVHQSRGNFGAEWRRYAQLFLAKHRHGSQQSVVTPRFWGQNRVYLQVPAQVVEFFRLLVATATACMTAGQRPRSELGRASALPAGDG